MGYAVLLEERRCKMQDMQAYLQKLHMDGVDCALISKLATDPRKNELFDRLAEHLAMLA
jgi:hypothetical protein